MTDAEMKIEVEAEDFIEELTDEALDRQLAKACDLPARCYCG